MTEFYPGDISPGLLRVISNEPAVLLTLESAADKAEPKVKWRPWGPGASSILASGTPEQGASGGKIDQAYLVIRLK
jgi:hypothetical protein